VLRREFANGRPADVPDAPVHPRVAARRDRPDGGAARDTSQGDLTKAYPTADPMDPGPTAVVGASA
jgi:hypothetical protein